MRIHAFLHGADEGLGKIGEWIAEHGHALSNTRFYLGETLPHLDDVDWLIVMGGAMNIYQDREYPWLRDERRFLEKFIETGRPLLGICLGAQLIADALGARVYQNAEMEIGWWPVRFSERTKNFPPFAAMPRELTPLHWHGDTFDTPPGAICLAESDGCPMQAFAVGENIVGLQFHLEVREEDVRAFVGESPPPPARFVQTREQIADGALHFPETHRSLYRLLDALAS